MGLLKTLLKLFFLSVFSGLLLTVSTGALFLYAVEATFLDPGFYKNELEKTRAYDLVYPYLSSGFGSDGQQVETILVAAGVKVEDILTKAWVKSQAENLIDNAFSYLKGQSPILNLTVYPAEPKGRLLDLVEKKLGASARLALSKTVDAQVPDAVNLAEKFDTSPMVQAREAVSVLQVALLVLGALVVVFCLFIFLLTRDHVPSTFRWIGFPLASAGILCLAVVEFFKIQSVALLAQYPDASSVQIARLVSTDALAAFGQNLGFPAAFLIILGVGMLVGSFFIRTRPAQGTNASPPGEQRKKPNRQEEENEDEFEEEDGK